MPTGKSSSAMAAGVSATSLALKSGSTQARATSFAPLNGPILGFEERQHLVDGVARDDAFFDQQGFQRAGAGGAEGLTVVGVGEA